MSEFQHTPGPWIQSKRMMICQIAILSDEDQLATVYGETGENQANANLIAAAPDLLEALEVLKDAFIVAVGATSPYAREALRRPMAAIAKARGES